MPSPWAEIRNSTRLDTPPPDMGPWAPVGSDVALPTQGMTVRPNVTEDPIAQNIENDQKELQKVRWNQAHPWGTPENHPGKLGKVAHVFSEIGNIAGNIVAPNVMANIPGTQMNMQEKESGLTNRLNKELEQSTTEQGQDATTAKTRLDTELEPAKTKSLEDYQGAETAKINEDLAMGPSIIRGHDYAVTRAIKEGRDPATDPTVQFYEDAMDRMKKDAAAKALEHVNLQGPKGAAVGGSYDPNKGKYLDAQGRVIPNPTMYERPNTTNITLPEHAFEFSDKQLEALAKPLRDRSDRIERMKQTLAQGTPQADALIAPELLTAMAGGQGSGLRMNEAEISRIVGGRSAWENLRANMQHWSTDPNAARSITPEQQRQIRGLVNAIDAKVQKKIGILNEAGSALVGTSNPTEQHRLVAETRQRLQQEDINQTLGDNSPIVQHSPSTGQYRYSMDGGKTWQTGQPPKQQ